MYRTALSAVLVTLLFSATHAVAQTRNDDVWQFWVKGQGQFYGNFFQSPEGSPETDVRALLGEIGASVGLGRSLRAYGQVNHLRYDEEGLDSSNGIRLGLRMQGTPHAFDVFAEQLSDRPSFDVGDEFDRADIRTVAGEYSLRVVEDWQISIDGELQEQEFEITPARDNEFGAIGAAVRWRGSRIFSPEIGLRTGERDVNDATLSYDQRDAYLQIRSSLTPALYLSVRFRDRRREYSTDAVGSSNFGREDKRRQIAASADWTTSEALTWNLYVARENVDTNVEGRDFDTSLAIVGVTFRF
jgi:hypothetical protein